MSHPATVLADKRSQPIEIERQVEREVSDLLRSLAVPSEISPLERRGIIARYAAVLEGNFIYWMTATLLSVRSDEARAIVIENLREEVYDCHPAMMRKFAIAAHAFPTDSDSLAVNWELTNVRRLAGRLSGVQMLLTMAFFEFFIQGFMAFLAEIAGLQGSAEREYTDVHGVCDIAHTRELFHGLSAEIALEPVDYGASLFDGVEALKALILKILGLENADGRQG